MTAELTVKMEVVIKGLQDRTWGHYTLATFRHLDAPVHHTAGSDNAQVYIVVTGMVKHIWCLYSHLQVTGCAVIL